MPSFEVRSFGPFTLDTARNQLHRGKIEIRMQPQPFRLLVLLTSRPGELITREEIQKELWEPDTFVDFEQGLNYAIRRVREALNDSGSTPVYLKTEPKRGYRFIGMVQRTTTLPEAEPVMGPTAAPVAIVPTVIAGPAEPVVVVPIPATPQGKTPTTVGVGASFGLRRWKGAGLLAVALTAVLCVIYFAVRRAHPLSIAVLPFQNLTGESENDALADNLTDALTAQLRMMGAGHVRIMSLASGDSRQAPHEAAEVTGRALGATFVLQGTLHAVKNGSGATLGLQLIRSSDGSAPWSRYEEGNSSGMLSDSNQLAAEILTSKEIGGAPIGNAKVSIYSSPSPAASAAFEQGKRAFRERSQESLNEAADDFKTATRADPHFADAFAQLAMAYEHLGSYGWMPQQEAREQANHAVQEALLLNPRLADALAARGYKEWFYEWNWTAAEQDFRQALQAEPENVDALHWYALLLATRGETKQAIQKLELALQLEPRSKTLRTNRGWLDYLDGNFPGASARMEGVLHDDPYFFSARLKLWAAYTAERNSEAAMRQLRSISLDLLSPKERVALEEAYQLQGYSAALQSWGGKVSEALKPFTLFTAQMSMASGDRESAIHVLQRGYADHDGWMVFVPRDALLAPLLHEPRLEGLRASLARGQGKRD